jgi:nicotinic acid mononucleotide adenylyltransferase
MREASVGAPWQLGPDAWAPRYARAAERLNDSDRLLGLTETVEAAEARGHRLAFAAATATLSGAGRVGVFTGSFNPATWAHVAVGEAARERLRLDALVWACSRVTVDKETVERATLLDRIAQMDALALAEGHGDRVVVVDAGLYVDQARALRSVMDAGTKLFLIVGYDKIGQILDPHYYEDRDASLADLFGLAELCVARRGSADEGDLAELLALPGNRQYAGVIHYLPVDAQVAGLSSTEVRERARYCEDEGVSALANVVPPEGGALACATGAYRDDGAERHAVGGGTDAYAWRQRWLAALRMGGWPKGERLNLRFLVARTVETTQCGEQARRWLTGERWPGGPTSVRDAVRSVIA